MKKTPKAKAKPVPQKSLEKTISKKEEPTSEQENPFDFGGLPQRDLKKNLGCG